MRGAHFVAKYCAGLVLLIPGQAPPSAHRRSAIRHALAAVRRNATGMRAAQFGARPSEVQGEKNEPGTVFSRVSPRFATPRRGVICR